MPLKSLVNLKKIINISYSYKCKPKLCCYVKVPRLVVGFLILLLRIYCLDFMHLQSGKKGKKKNTHFSPPETALNALIVFYLYQHITHLYQA